MQNVEQNIDAEHIMYYKNVDNVLFDTYVL